MIICLCTVCMYVYMHAGMYVCMYVCMRLFFLRFFKIIFNSFAKTTTAASIATSMSLDILMATGCKVQIPSQQTVLMSIPTCQESGLVATTKLALCQRGLRSL